MNKEEKAMGLLKRVRPYLGGLVPIFETAEIAFEYESSLIKEIDDFLASQKIDK